MKHSGYPWGSFLLLSDEGFNCVDSQWYYSFLCGWLLAKSECAIDVRRTDVRHCSGGLPNFQEVSSTRNSVMSFHSIYCYVHACHRIERSSVKNSNFFLFIYIYVYIYLFIYSFFECTVSFSESTHSGEQVG